MRADIMQLFYIFSLPVSSLTAFQIIVTRSSADAERPRDAPQIRNIALEKACNQAMTFKDTQGHYNIDAII